MRINCIEGTSESLHSTFPIPIKPEVLAVQADLGYWFHEEESLAPVAQDSWQHNTEQPIKM